MQSLITYDIHYIHIKVWGGKGITHDDEIKRLKDIGLETKDLNIVHNVIYNLAAYGPKSIPAISAIIDTKADKDVRSYGLETIEKIKERSVSFNRF